MMPALFTQMSTGPSSRSMRATVSRTAAPSRMSHAYPRAARPPLSISRAVSVAPSALTSTIAILQPSAASVTASALPRLRAPPVTSATRSLIPRSIAYLPSLELGLALAEERLDAFGRIFRLQCLQERARLDLERLVDRLLETIVHRFDEQARGDRRPLGDLRGERLRIGERLPVLA